MHSLFCRFKFFLEPFRDSEAAFCLPWAYGIWPLRDRFARGFRTGKENAKGNEMDGDLLQKDRLGAIIGRI